MQTVTRRGVILVVLLTLGLAACSSSTSKSDPKTTAAGTTSVSWSDGKSTKSPAFAGIGTSTTHATLVLASFKPSNDAILLNPVNSDFKANDWLFSTTLKIANGTLATGTYSGEMVTRPYLYFYDSSRNQTYSQSLGATTDAAVTFTSVTDKEAKGTLKLTDSSAGASLTTSFTATIRKI
ncbi:MAG: hypothetical protein ACOYN3_06955 [Acidimicrobiia bacterium]